MPKPLQVIVIHGYGATPESHWFPWLRDQLGAENVTIPVMPDSSAPDADTWVTIASEAIAGADANTVVIGHSLGGITALRGIAAQREGLRLAGIVVIAGFAENLPGYEPLNPFTVDNLNMESLRAVSPHRTVLVADVDPILDVAVVRRLAARLDANVIEVPGAGHFQADDGVTELPQLMDVLRGIADAD